MSQDPKIPTGGPRDATAGADVDTVRRALQEAVEQRRIVEEKLAREVAAHAETQEHLKRRTAEREEVELELRGMLALVREQEDAMRAMATPILKVWNGVLTMPVVGRLDSVRATQMMENLLRDIVKTRSRFTILDVTGAEDLDASAANHLLNLVRAAGLLGTRCLVSGISPKMAQTIIGLGLDLMELSTFATLEEALHHAIEEAGKKPRRRFESNNPG